MTDKRPFFIVNPHSGAGSTGHLWPEWEKQLRDKLGSVDFAYTRGILHAVSLTREALDNGYDRIIAVGGDGTLNEVLNGFFDDGKVCCPDAALAYIPNGTGADFSRTLGFHGRSIDEHIERLLSARATAVDCGEVRFVDSKGEETNRLFINESSLGFSANTADAVNRASKHFRGRLPFLIGVIRCLSTLKNPVLRISVEGRLVHEAPTLMVAVANGKYFGGSMMIAPHAEIDDGLLDIIVISRMSRLTLLRKIKSIYSGQHLDEPEVTALRGKTVHISAIHDEVLLEMDGEQPGKLAAEYRVAKKTIPFVY
ncbi:MAG: diacylglycerol kinase family lipid kinase [Spirochaetales bacterium]|nr:diacylglycerol kinase family lipid kinase [Spirochaetales bacterium]